MNVKRNLLTKEADAKRGRAIAEWLNRHDPRRSYSPAYGLIANAVVLRSAVVRGGVAREDAPGVVLGVGLKRRLAPGEQDSGAGVVKMRAELEMQGRRVKFRLVPMDEESERLYKWGELVNSGNASRLMICPSCRKFWYCEGRTDKKVCSVRCKVALWQKTPEGRAAKAASMRRYRARIKAEFESMSKGYTRKRGRNVHVSLKKGE